MPVWRLDIEYDGTRYSGWQRQPNARTVQGEIERVAEDLFKERVDLGGSGRTDAGVHALGQVAHLRVRAEQNSLTPFKLQIALNKNLPADINILRVANAPDRFHARHDAIARYYLYQISTRRTAFGKQYVWWVRDRLDVAAMNLAAREIVGRHDFARFSERRDNDNESTVVAVETAHFQTVDNLILFRIGASHFLWKMVRRLVGMLAEVGRGKTSVADFKRLLQNSGETTAEFTAPPSGLFLERVLYRGDAPPINRNPAFPVS